MKVTYEFHERVLGELSLSGLIQRSEIARLAIHSQLQDIEPEFAERMESFVAKTEEGGYSGPHLVFYITLRFPGANAFAKYDWGKHMTRLTALPTGKDITNGFMSENDESSFPVEFRDSRLGQAIAWAFDKGPSNIESRMSEVEGVRALKYFANTS